MHDACDGRLPPRRCLSRHLPPSATPWSGEGSLQARADGEARISLLPAFRAASLVTDALAVRSESDTERAFDGLPSARRQAFAEIAALNGALQDALERPSVEARLAALK